MERTETGDTSPSKPCHQALTFRLKKKSEHTHPCIDACSVLSCFADTCTQAADMFALGATAYELASASRLPETGPDYAAIRASPQAPASLPPELGALIKALMDPDPSQRPTARQVLDNEALISMVMLPGPQPWARDTIPVQYITVWCACAPQSDVRPCISCACVGEVNPKP